MAFDMAAGAEGFGVAKHRFSDGLHVGKTLGLDNQKAVGNESSEVKGYLNPVAADFITDIALERAVGDGPEVSEIVEDAFDRRGGEIIDTEFFAEMIFFEEFCGVVGLIILGVGCCGKRESCAHYSEGERGASEDLETIGR